MQYSVEINEEAENDITAIYRYIAEALANPLAAQKLLLVCFACSTAVVMSDEKSVH